MRILLADDQPKILATLNLLLQDAGHITACCHSAALVLLRAPIFMPNCVVTDLELGDGNGFDVIRQLRERQICARFVVMTGALDATTPPDLRGVPLLRKPFDPDVLLRLLDSPASIDGHT